MEENVNPDPVNQDPMNQNPNKKSGKGIFIAVGIMAIIIVALVGYIMVSGSEKSEESGAENKSTSSSKVSESEDKKDSKEKEDEEEEEEEKNTSKKEKNTSKDDEDEEKEDDDEKNSSSSFGKKDKNTAKNETTNEDTEKKDDDKEETSKKDTASTANLSGDWKSAEFTLDGKSYKINDDYTTFKTNGWYVDLKDAGYEDGYILNKNDKVYSTIDFLNDKFEDASVNVGFINLGDSAKDITECQVWAVTVDNKYSDTPVDFTLPGGLKNGSTLAEVEAAYGKPTDEDDIYRSEDLGYTTYTYDNELNPQLRLTIWDEGGLTKFEYKIY